MPAFSKLLDDTVVLKAETILKEIGSYGLVAQRLRAVISAKKHGISKVADVFDITNATLISWIKKCKYNDDIGIKPKKSKTPKLNEKQIKQIDSWFTKEPNLTINAIRLKILNTFNITISKSAVHNYLRNKLDLSHITPRPMHYKQDKEKVEEFKEEIKKNSKTKK